MFAPLFAVTLLSLFIFFVGWREFFESLAGANLFVYTLAFVSMCCCLCARSLVWQRVLEIAHRSRSLSFVGTLFLTATFCKYVTPYGQVAAGPGIAAIVSRRAEIRYETGLATIISSDFSIISPTTRSVGWLLAPFSSTSRCPNSDTRGLSSRASSVLLRCLWELSGRFGPPFPARDPRRSTDSPSSVDCFDAGAALLSREQLTERLDEFYKTLDLVADDRRGVFVALAYAHLG